MAAAPHGHVQRLQGLFRAVVAASHSIADSGLPDCVVETYDSSVTAWAVKLRYPAPVPFVLVRVAFDVEPSKMPQVFVVSPRLLAPFIHGGAVCNREMGADAGWRLAVDNVKLLLCVLHASLDPAGLSIEGGRDEQYSEAEHAAGLGLIRRAHAAFFRRATAAAEKGVGDAVGARDMGEDDEEEGQDAVAASAGERQLVSVETHADFANALRLAPNEGGLAVPLTLGAAAATSLTHGVAVVQSSREASDAFLGAWNAADGAATFGGVAVPCGGHYRVSVTYALATACDGNELVVSADGPGGGEVRCRLQATGADWGVFREMDVGTLWLGPAAAGAAAPLFLPSLTVGTGRGFRQPLCLLRAVSLRWLAPVRLSVPLLFAGAAAGVATDNGDGAASIDVSGLDFRGRSDVTFRDVRIVGLLRASGRCVLRLERCVVAAAVELAGAASCVVTSASLLQSTVLVSGAAVFECCDSRLEARSTANAVGDGAGPTAATPVCLNGAATVVAAHDGGRCAFRNVRVVIASAAAAPWVHGFSAAHGATLTLAGCDVTAAPGSTRGELVYADEARVVLDSSTFRVSVSCVRIVGGKDFEDPSLIRDVRVEAPAQQEELPLAAATTGLSFSECNATVERCVVDGFRFGIASFGHGALRCVDVNVVRATTGFSLDSGRCFVVRCSTEEIACTGLYAYSGAKVDLEQGAFSGQQRAVEVQNATALLTAVSLRGDDAGVLVHGKSSRAQMTDCEVVGPRGGHSEESSKGSNSCGISTRTGGDVCVDRCRVKDAFFGVTSMGEGTRITCVAVDVANCVNGFTCTTKSLAKLTDCSTDVTQVAIFVDSGATAEVIGGDTSRMLASCHFGIEVKDAKALIRGAVIRAGSSCVLASEGATVEAIDCAGVGTLAAPSVDATVRNDGAKATSGAHVSLTKCSFRDVFFGVTSVGEGTRITCVAVDVANCVNGFSVCSRSVGDLTNCSSDATQVAVFVCDAATATITGGDAARVLKGVMFGIEVRDGKALIRGVAIRAGTSCIVASGAETTVEAIDCAGVGTLTAPSVDATPQNDGAKAQSGAHVSLTKCSFRDVFFGVTSMNEGSRVTCVEVDVTNCVNGFSVCSRSAGELTRCSADAVQVAVFVCDEATATITGGDPSRVLKGAAYGIEVHNARGEARVVTAKGGSSAVFVHGDTSSVLCLERCVLEGPVPPANQGQLVAR